MTNESDNDIVCLDFCELQNRIIRTLPWCHGWVYWQFMVSFTIFDHIQVTLLYIQCLYVGIHSSTLPPLIYSCCFDTSPEICMWIFGFFSGKTCLLKDSELDEIGKKAIAMCERLKVILKVQLTWILYQSILYCTTSQAYHVYSLITPELLVVPGTKLSRYS